MGHGGGAGAHMASTTLTVLAWNLTWYTAYVWHRSGWLMAYLHLGSLHRLHHGLRSRRREGELSLRPSRRSLRLLGVARSRVPMALPPNFGTGLGWKRQVGYDLRQHLMPACIMPSCISVTRSLAALRTSSRTCRRNLGLTRKICDMTSTVADEKQAAMASNERSPLLQRVPVNEQRRAHYPHQTVRLEMQPRVQTRVQDTHGRQIRRFCTIALTTIPVLTLAIIFFCIAIAGQSDLFGDHQTEQKQESLLTFLTEHLEASSPFLGSDERLSEAQYTLPHPAWPSSEGIDYDKLKQDPSWDAFTCVCEGVEPVLYLWAALDGQEQNTSGMDTRQMGVVWYQERTCEL